MQPMLLELKVLPNQRSAHQWVPDYAADSLAASSPQPCVYSVVVSSA